jgi:hypothetical protein
MNRLRPRTTVLSGATIGLIAGAAIYGAVSSSASDKAPTATKPVSAIAAAPVSAARCAAGQKLENGVCIVHVQRTVVVPATGGASSLNSGSASSGPSASGGAAEPGDDSAAGARHESENEADENEAAEHAEEAAEHAGEAAEHTGGGDAAESNS